MFRRLILLINSIAYALYVMAKKVSGLSSIASEVTPSFKSDEIIRPASGEIYAIVVKYAKFGPEDGLAELLATLQAREINVVVVCNGQPSAEALSSLRQSAQRVLVRKNVGRDFGAYRAATLL